MGVRALLIEDDAKLAELTAEFLRARDVAVNIVEDGESGLCLLYTSPSPRD